MVFAYLAFNNYNIVLAFIAGAASGIICGLLTSLLVVRFKFHSLITTIAVSTIAKSIAASLYGGMPLPVPVIKSTGLYKFLNSTVGGVSMVFIIAVVIYVILFIIQERTKYGQYIYALGENRMAVKEAGIKEGRILVIIFVTSAFFAALAGVLMVFVVYGSGQPKMGSSFFLDGFTVVFLGAMVMKLGKTNVVGTFLGGIMLAIIVNGLTLMSSSFAASQIIKGILLVIGIVMAAFGQNKRRGKAGRLQYE
jgi:ribose/xylose/arabinose/galactoside ABC-type transport system permease subunit